jgi:hypothetical protein
MALVAPAGASEINGFSELADGTLAVAWATRTADQYYSEILQLVHRDGTVLSAADGNANYLLERFPAGWRSATSAGRRRASPTMAQVTRC